MRNKKNNGAFLGIASALTWGIDTVLVGIILGTAPFINNENSILLAPFISTFLHDLFSTIWTFIYLLITGGVQRLINALKTRSARYVMLGALLGGPVGMTGYLLAIKYLGPSYTASISSIYPAVGAILAAIILKEKLNKKAYIGLMMSIFGIIALGYSKGSDNTSILGFIFVALCIFGWGSEAVICAYGMRDEEVDSESALQIRQLTSAIVYGVIIIPIIKAIPLMIDAVKGNVILLIAITALFGTISYLCYYGAIHKIGATKAMGINITYFVWTIIFDVIFLKSSLSIKTIIFGSIVMIGSYLVAKDQNV
ncbi:DMT family transporter [Clostridium tertium]|uniref:DMT family transporter n=1 Tax=Clostridium tertium TaxID=1559 RepID=UPI00232F806F|nr:DMT family transporter [Clostridium tertium]MDB1921746.1 DMT family transporter [Clostridium tertium]MDB1924949.1 DMT family transporter [Clostridium tertium]MDB1929388.1 DMT family transporter [Clostridium tertium]